MGAKKIVTQKTQLDNSERLWDKETARDFIGIPRSSFDLYFARGEIPHLKIGKHIRFIPEQLMAWAKKRAK